MEHRERERDAQNKPTNKQFLISSILHIRTYPGNRNNDIYLKASECKYSCYSQANNKRMYTIFFFIKKRRKKNNITIEIKQSYLLQPRTSIYIHLNFRVMYIREILFFSSPLTAFYAQLFSIHKCTYIYINICINIFIYLFLSVEGKDEINLMRVEK